MKKKIFYRVGLITMIVAIIMTMPMVAQSLTLTPIKTDSFETKEESGGGAYAWLDEAFGLGIIGPGAGTNNFLTNGVFTIVNASSLNTAAWYAVWKIWSTNTSYDLYNWAAIYQLDGDPGLSADISLAYTYTYSHFNASLDGRSKSESIVGIYWDLVPASMSAEVNENMFTRWMLDLLNPFSSKYEYELLSYSNEYYALGLSWGDATKTGSIPLGSMEADDYLFIVGQLKAQTEAQIYLVPAATVATSVTSFMCELVINETPPTPPDAVPEPSTMLLLASGLIGLVGYGRKKFFKK